MPRTYRSPEQELALLREQERKLKDRRRQAEAKLRRQRGREAAQHLANLVQVLKRYGVTKLTPQRLEQALASLNKESAEGNDLVVPRPPMNQSAASSATTRQR